MDKKRANQVLVAHACCSFNNNNNYLCLMCPWHKTDDCKFTAINEEIVNEAINELRGKNMKRMKLDDIKIRESFENTTPSEEKMDECRYNWSWFHRQDRFIVVDHNNVLIDGYCMYLVLKENNQEYADVKIYHCRKKKWYRKNTKDWKIPRYKDNPTTYIYGTHPNSKDTKTYMWRVPESWNGWANNVQIGDTIVCATKNGYAPVVVNKIEVLDKCPLDIPVKKVCKKEIRRNGMVVEI